LAQVSSVGTRAVRAFLLGPTGLASRVAELSEREGFKFAGRENAPIVEQNVSFEMVERSEGVNYPAIYVYCEKVANTLREKFRRFSGEARIAVEVRLSEDRLAELQRKLMLWTEAVTNVLENHRGDWGEGMFYGGGYEISFSSVKRGGKNYIQTAKISFNVDVSIA
jgi:hypothetical protein